MTTSDERDVKRIVHLNRTILSLFTPTHVITNPYAFLSTKNKELSNNNAKVYRGINVVQMTLALITKYASETAY